MYKTLALVPSTASIPLGVIRWAIARANPFITDEWELNLVMQDFRKLEGYKAPSKRISYGLMRVVMDELSNHYF